MKLKVLGCYGTELGNHHTTGFLIDNSLLVDAGTITTSMGIDELIKIKNVLISHVHFDHIKGIPFLTDVVFGRIKEPINIIGVKEVIESLKKYMLNNIVWPDFTAIHQGNSDSPVIKLKEIKDAVFEQVGDFEVKAVRVNHTVPTTGFIIRKKNVSILYSSDTKATEEIWEEAKKTDNLKAAIIEASFPTNTQKIADISGHFTPAGLKKELVKIDSLDIPVYIYHLKSQYNIESMKKELKTIKSHKIIFLEDGREYEF
ncbi:MAG: 3',5'-cyclic-nucleotide phosphodiesterase [Nitrospirae bacterium]|nr:3',5'-cyclic-nucleotide phosphodiesterase [Nitrospirota bacterium]